MNTETSELRRVRFNGEELGKLSTSQLLSLISWGEIDQSAEFYSPRQGRWLLLRDYILDFYPTDKRLAEMASAGIESVEVLDGVPEETCPACRAEVGKVYPVDAAPPLPPANCSCLPWCRLTYIPKDPNADSM